jgi:Ca-activated chloride channel family protein
LNFLVTVLQTFARGDESGVLSPDVSSAFENCQKSVPFVALTTMQMRDSVEKDRSLDAFVLEYQTFVQTPSLRSGYVFVPFGFRHDNPLYTVGSQKPEKKEVLELFARYAQEAQPQKLATNYGFNPDMEWKAPFKLPSGRTLIEAQKLWKVKKDAGRPVAAMFLADVSGSMAGTKIQQLRRALVDGGSFIAPENAIGLASFSSSVSILLPIRPFQLVQKSAFQSAVKRLEAEGNTAMYDGVVVALSMLADYKRANPDVRPMLFVLTDGQTNRGLSFDEVEAVVGGMRVPIYTIGFEADIKELSRLSSLVEAASLNAGEADLRYKIGALLNSQM